MTLGPGIRDAAVVLGSRSVAATDLAQAAGVAAPRGLQTRRLADADEDRVTFAVAAVRALLQRRDVADVGQLHLVGDLDAEAATVLTEALDLASVAVGLHPADAGAAADALLVALNGPAEPASIVVAVDDGRGVPAGAPRGAGAVALWLEAEAPVRLEAEAHRRQHSGDPADATLQELFADTADDGSAAIAAVEEMPGVAARTLRAYAGRLVPTSLAERGHLGAAEPYAVLLEALAAPQAETGVVWYVPTTGGAVAARFGRRVAVPGLEEALAAEVTRSNGITGLAMLRAWEGAERAVAQGAYVSLQAYLQETAARYRLEAQECPPCDRVLFPPREDCPECGGPPSGRRRLSGRGHVYSRTRIAAGGGPTEFDPLQRTAGDYGVAIVELEEGPRVAAMLTGPGAAGLAIGDPVQLAFRLLYVQEGVRRYGFKAVRA